MQTHISILRGINVSGHKKILMTDLKALYEELGFKDVVTYIQSGNVIFKTDKKASGLELAEKIEKKISGKYKFYVPVLTRVLKDMERVLETNPFLDKKGIDLATLHVTFLSENPAQVHLDALTKFDYPPDRFIVSDREIFLHCPGGYGNTKFSNSFFENKLKVGATTRNWKTVNTLAEMASRSAVNSLKNQ